MKNLLLVLLVLPFIGFGQKVCISGNCVNGQGTCTYADIPGSKYVGEFMNGKKNGQGTFTWADGAKYIGGWMDGKMHGQGTFTKADGAIFKGLFKNGKYVGE
jgi:hypothetical protein